MRPSSIDVPVTTDSSIHSLISALASNLRAGLRLALLRPQAAAYLHVSPDQAVALILFNLALGVGLDWVEAWPDATFNGYALPDYALALAGILLASYFTSVLVRDRACALALTVALYGMLPLFAMVAAAMRIVQARLPALAGWENVLLGIYLAWLGAATASAIYGLVRRRKLVMFTGLLFFVVAWGLPGVYYSWQSSFWYDKDAAQGTEELERVDAERLLYEQQTLLQDALDKIQPQRPNVSDLYLVGFGGDAAEDVFMKEVRYVQELFNRRFDTHGRSVALINNPATVDEVPLATATNLNLVLENFGQVIDADEDVVLLFLTSHGTPDNRLAVSFEPLPLNPITPEALKQALDQAGIRWRIIVVSACYSGAFVESLRDPYTMVMTAAAADKTSFGCGVDREFTYFGEALFRDQLTRLWSLPQAFRSASAAIQRRERAEGLPPSEPQIFIGEHMAARLPRMEAELSERLCNENPDPRCASAPTPRTQERPVTVGNPPVRSSLQTSLVLQ